jgi:hypothetical protein
VSLTPGMSGHPALRAYVGAGAAPSRPMPWKGDQFDLRNSFSLNLHCPLPSVPWISPKIIISS